MWDRSDVDVLLWAVLDAVLDNPHSLPIVEVGGYLGRSLSVMASVVHQFHPAMKVHSIDPGYCRECEENLHTPERHYVTLGMKSNNDIRRAHMKRLRLDQHIQYWDRQNHDVVWDGTPIRLLVENGVAAYPRLAASVLHFERYLIEGGHMVLRDFHNSNENWAAQVGSLIDDLVASGKFEQAFHGDNLVVLRKLSTPSEYTVELSYGRGQPQTAEWPDPAPPGMVRPTDIVLFRERFPLRSAH